MLISLIIVGYNHKFCIGECLDSVFQQEYKDNEIIYVDNNSKDGSLDYIRYNYKNVKTIKNSSNFGFSKANNQGLKIAKGEYILFINPDVTLKANTLSVLYDFMYKEKCAGMCMPKILLKENPKIINSMGMTINKYGRIIHLEDGRENNIDSKPREVPCLSGAAIFARKEVLENIGGFYDDFFAYGEDAELSLRCWSKGWKCYVVPEAEVYHIRNSAAKKSEEYYKIARYYDQRNKYWNAIIYFPVYLLIRIFINVFLKEIIIVLKSLIKSILNFKIQIELKARTDFIIFIPKLIKKRRELKLKDSNILQLIFNAK